MVPTRQAMKDAGLTPDDIGKVLLVGGSTRIPAVQEAIRKYLGKEPFKESTLTSALRLELRFRQAFLQAMSKICSP